ncbi:hypothetical protein N7452_002128 [Penicillium brevicompactum]|uniref:histidine kinase n=1 Tax=Penicillium brevicompactum TaxID=5074 RepID=A0A9W9UQT5_PENBR|nr:hypothetical protein N7452_002128 [Penicillium brevicompactum]
MTPEVVDEERERIRDLSRYYCTVLHSTPAGAAVPTGDDQPAGCELAKDITLTALAQLGVLRFNANRSFVSIIDGDTQHIIAEATGSVSLRNKDRHAPGNGIYLGARSLDLTWGVCPHTIRLFTGRETNNIESDNVTANKSRYIIRDFTKEDCFKDRPYVKEWPHMRFYAEVPLFSATGYVLGSYCIVDDKPWTEFGDDQVSDLQEVADAIGHHLENVRVGQAHLRAERLVKGLTNFAKEHAEFDPTEASNGGRIQLSVSAAHLATNGKPEVSEPAPTLVTPFPIDGDTPSSGQSSMSTITGQESGFFVHDHQSSTDPSSLHSISDHPTALSPGEEKLLGDAMKPGDTAAQNIEKGISQLSMTESTPVYERIAALYSRASVLLRESMDLDGVVLLDACPTNFAFVPDEVEDWEPLPKVTDSQFPTAPLPSPLGLPRVVSHEFKRASDILSCALKSNPSGDIPTLTPEIPNGLLHQLLRACPQGQVINLNAEVEEIAEEDYLNFGRRNPSNSTSECLGLPALSKHLAQRIPDAKSAIFLPLWDWNKSRWLSGILAWTNSNFRALGLEELHYFNVFGDSIISEVSRIHWASDERSKFDFISSVSHELRSPLHGILASAELLNATSLDGVQNDMVGMIEKSGLTLLDTTNHILDFCKVNNLRESNKLSSISGNDISNLVSEFDVSELVEEVANILYTGHRAPLRLTEGSRKMSSDAGMAGSDTAQLNPTSQMSVVIRNDRFDNWRIRSLAGAWRRIVMNLLGNAIKWTEVGFVEVSLSKTTNASDSQPLVHLSITDTGRGIAAEFIKHKLFVPFSQEDPLSEGVGLGLSTVHQLVTSLGGHVNIRSEIGIGTQADVYLPVQYLPPMADKNSQCVPGAVDNCSSPIHACLVGFNGYPDLTETPTGILTVEGKRKLCIQSTLASIFMTNLNWTISLADSIEEAHGQVVVIEEEILNRASIEYKQSVADMAARFGVEFFFVLSDDNATITPELSANLVRIAQPFGPHKVYHAVERFVTWREETFQAVPVAFPDVTPLACPLTEDALPSDAALDHVEGTLPAASLDTTGSSGDLIASTPHAPTKQSLAHVLIVDDNDINLKIMATFMAKINCSYETAVNGLIAFEKYKASASRYDFVLMDISMPVMDGLVSTSKIREYERAAGLTPTCIMAVTGVSSAGFQHQAYTAGIDKYLIKPLSLNDLRTLMNLA